MAKYNLEALVGTVYVFFQGVGNLLAQPTLYIMRYFDQRISTETATGGFLTNPQSNNQLLFDKALRELRSSAGSTVLLNSNVTQVKRKAHKVHVEVNTPGGCKRITASKLLIAIPPKLSNLPFMDLSSSDSNLFGKFNNSYYYAAIMSNTGIPADVLRLTNVDPEAPLSVPAQPAMFVLEALGKGLYGAYYGSTTPLTEEAVKAEILTQVKRLGYSNQPEILAYSDHSPFLLTASTDDIKDGFYEKLLELQGKQNTWWTGAAWNKPATADLWKYTEEQVLPKLMESLK